MIITSDIRVTYRGNGQTTEFPFAFPFYDADYICVKIKDELTGLVTKLDADYFVDTNTNTVIYPGYPPGEEPPQSQQPPILPETSTITIYRNTEISQLIDLGSKYPLPIIEQALDKITEILQELKDNVDRSVKVDETSTETPDMYLQEIRTSTARAVESKLAAAASEAAALASQQAAAASASAAATSQQAAAASASAAATSQQAAAASAASAAQSATDLETAVQQAEASASAAAGSAMAAATSETNAATSAGAAFASQQAAAGLASAAATSETNASASAANASNSASAAAGSATEAAETAASIDHHAGYRQPTTAYSDGAMATYHALPYGWYLEATTGGITDSGDITLPTPLVENATVTDGTVVWTIRSISAEATTTDKGLLSPSDKSKIDNIPASGGTGFNHREVITTSGTWTAPTSGYYKVTCIGGGGAGGSAGLRGGQGGGTTSFGSYLSAIGGGGGGGCANGNDSCGSGGGGAGNVATSYITLTANTAIICTIGAGGEISTTDNTAPTGVGAGYNRNALALYATAYGAHGAGGGTSGYSDSGGTGGGGGVGGCNGTGYGGGGGGSCGGYYGWRNGGGGNGSDNGSDAEKPTGIKQYLGGNGGDGAIIIEYYQPA